MKQQIISLIAYIKANPTLAPMLGMYSVGMVTWIFRDIPRRIWYFLLREMTTTLTITSLDEIYVDLLEWVTKHKDNKFIREFNLKNMSSGCTYWARSGKTMITPGDTVVYFKLGTAFCKMYKNTSKDSNGVETSNITLTILGRNRKPFYDLHELIKKSIDQDEEDKYQKIFQASMGKWEQSGKSFKRPLTSVILDTEVKSLALNTINKFIESRDWLINRGLPWRLGILLYGPPGTGKTSFIKALALEYDKPLYVLSLSGISDNTLGELMKSVPHDAIIAIEDLDAFKVTHEREETKDKKEITGGALTLSGLLNAIDGITSSDGRILIATSNHPENLDAALVRDGRFDLKLELSQMDTDMFKEYMKLAYPDFTIKYNIKLKKGISGATLQNLVLKNRNNPEKVLETAAVQVCDVLEFREIYGNA